MIDLIASKNSLVVNSQKRLFNITKKVIRLSSAFSRKCTITLPSWGSLFS
jgi:hypothetical protein